MTRNESHRQECVAWMISALNLLKLVCIDENGFYRQRIEYIALQGFDNSYLPATVGELRAILRVLLLDLDSGLLTSVADRARAEVFDDFLDHGAEYLVQGSVDRAGVIAGVVFEDTVRRVCRKHSIEEKGKNLDGLINALVKIRVFTDVKAKRARSAADVRTKATHAQWEEFERSDVDETINVTRWLLETELDK